MKEKKKVSLIIALAAIIITNFLTYNVTSIATAMTSENRFVKLSTLEAYIKANYLYEVTDEQIEVGELKGLVASLEDPYSSYLTEEEYKSLEEETTGKFYGIGVYVSIDEDDLITVVSPIEDSPADVAGIKMDDKIIAVNDIEFAGSELDDAVSEMKGEINTEVKVTVYRPSTEEILDFTIVRDEINSTTVIEDKLGDYGYIGITQFSDNTANDFNEALSNLKAENIKAPTTISDAEAVYPLVNATIGKFK